MDWLSVGSKAADIVKKYRYAFLVVLIGLALMLIPTGKTSPEPQPEKSQIEQKPQLDDRLADILSQIQGAGKVQVMLTVAAGEKTIYQTDQDISGGESTSSRFDTVIITDENRAEAGLVQQINPATYLGAIIVCQGADNASVRLAIVEAVSRATGLGADRISVLKMK